MSFAIEKLKPIPRVRTMMSIRPRRRLTGWTVNGTHGNVYQIAWAERYTVGVYGESFSSATEEESLADCASSDDSWFHDRDANILYFNPASTGNPNTLVTVVEWDMFFATEFLNWFRQPQNTAGEEAAWHGGLVRPPIPNQGNPDLLFGYSPIQVTEIQVQIADGLNQEHLYEWSLNGSQVRVWECIGELAAENISEIFTGVAGAHTVDSGVLGIAVSDPLKLMDKLAYDKYFSTIDFPRLDLDYQGAPIRKLYGYLQTFLPVNIDFDGTTATNVNRDWVVSQGSLADAATVSELVDYLSVSNDATHTKVANAWKFFGNGGFGDKVIITDNGTPKYTTVVAVDYLTGIITHDSIGARTPIITDTVTRGFVSDIRIEVGLGAFNTLKFGRDWTEADFANGTRGFVLADNFEANFGGFTFDPSTQMVQVAAYGDKTLPKKLDGIADFGALSEKAGAVANPVVILWDILRNQIRGFRETVQLDEAAFEALVAEAEYVCGLAIPTTRGEDFPAWKDVVTGLLKTAIMRMHFKIDAGFSKLTLTQSAPTAGDGVDITEEEAQNIRFNFDYADTYSRFRVQMNGGELLLPTYQSSESKVAKFLHQVEKNYTLETLISHFLDLSTVLNRLNFILGERKGTASMLLPTKFIEQSIDDKVNLKTTRLPGFPLSETINARAYKLQQHEKSSAGVRVILDDQKGIEDNAGSW